MEIKSAGITQVVTQRKYGFRLNDYEGELRSVPLNDLIDSYKIRLFGRDLFLDNYSYGQIDLPGRRVILATHHSSAYWHGLLAEKDGLITGSEWLYHMDNLRHPDNASFHPALMPTSASTIIDHVRLMQPPEDVSREDMAKYVNNTNYITALHSLYPGLRFAFLSSEMSTFDWGGAEFKMRVPLSEIVGSNLVSAPGICSLDLDLFHTIAPDPDGIEYIVGNVTSKNREAHSKGFMHLSASCRLIMMFLSPKYTIKNKALSNAKRLIEMLANL